MPHLAACSVSLSDARDRLATFHVEATLKPKKSWENRPKVAEPLPELYGGLLLRSVISALVSRMGDQERVSADEQTSLCCIDAGISSLGGKIFYNTRHTAENAAQKAHSKACQSDASLHSPTAIRGLGDMKGLLELNLHCNNIRKIEGVSRLSRLMSLNLSSNQLTRIEGLDTLVHLTDLDLSCNRITAVEGLTRLDSLETLLLSYNRIRSLGGLAPDKFQRERPKLRTLDVRDNDVTDPQQIALLRGCTALRTLRFEDTDRGLSNPVCRGPDYFLQVKKALPALEVLDGMLVSEYKRTSASPRTRTPPSPPPQLTAIDKALKVYKQRLARSAAAPRTPPTQRQPHADATLAQPRGIAGPSAARVSSIETKETPQETPSASPPRPDAESAAGPPGASTPETTALVAPSSTGHIVAQNIEAMTLRVAALAQELKAQREAEKLKRPSADTTRLSSLRADLVRAVRSARENAAAIDAMSKQAKSREAAAAAQQARMSALSGEAKRLRSALEDAQQKVLAQAVETARLQEQLRSVNTDATEARSAGARAAAQLEAVKSENKSLKDRLQSLTQAEKLNREQASESSRVAAERLKGLEQRVAQSDADAKRWRRASEDKAEALALAERRQAEILIKLESRDAAHARALEAAETRASDMKRRADMSEAREAVLKSRLGDARAAAQSALAASEARGRETAAAIEARSRETVTALEARARSLAEGYQKKFRTLQRAYEESARDTADLKEILRQRVAAEKRSRVLIAQLQALAAEQRQKLTASADRTNAVAAARHRHREQLSALERARDAASRAESEREELEAALESKCDEVERLQRELDESRRERPKVRKLEESLVVKNRMLDDQNETIVSLKEDKARMETELAQAEKREEDLAYQLDELADARADADDERRGWEKKLDALRADIKTAKESEVKAKETARGARELVAARDRDLVSLREQLERKGQMLEFVEREVRKIKTAQEDGEARLAAKDKAWSVKLNTSRAENASLQARVASADSLLSAARDECAKLLRKAADSERRVAETEAEMRTLLRELATHRKRAVVFARSLLGSDPLAGGAAALLAPPSSGAKE